MTAAQITSKPYLQAGKQGSTVTWMPPSGGPQSVADIVKSLCSCFAGFGSGRIRRSFAAAPWLPDELRPRLGNDVFRMMRMSADTSGSSTASLAISGGPTPSRTTQALASPMSTVPHHLIAGFDDRSAELNWRDHLSTELMVHLFDGYDGSTDLMARVTT